ncbi:MAG: peptidase S41, partial [Bacteroidota bacterium]
MKNILLLALTAIISCNAAGQNRFSKKEVIEDLEFLRESLEKAHYNLYTYVTKTAFDENFEAVKSSVTKDTLSRLE